MLLLLLVLLNVMFILKNVNLLYVRWGKFLQINSKIFLFKNFVNLDVILLYEDVLQKLYFIEYYHCKDSFQNTIDFFNKKKTILFSYYPVEKASFVQQLLSLIDSVSDGEQEIYFVIENNCSKIHSYYFFQSKRKTFNNENVFQKSVWLPLPWLLKLNRNKWQVCKKKSQQKNIVIFFVVDDVDADEEPTAKELTGQRTAILPEVDVFLRLLVVLFLLNHDKYEQVKKRKNLPF